MRLRFLEIKGKDSADFLHRVTAGTVKGVGVGAGRPGLLLSGQSKMIGQFDLLRPAESEFLLAAPEECAEALAVAFETLHFAEDLGILLSEREAGAEECAAACRSGGEPFGWEQSAGELTWPSPVPGYIFSTRARSRAEGFAFSRVRALVPWPGAEWNETTPALEAGMLPWIDRQKGCYPGQEVVELSLNVGHPARILLSVERAEPFAAGEKLPWGGGAAEVTTAAQSGGRAAAIVRVPWAKRDFVPPGWSRLRSHW